MSHQKARVRAATVTIATTIALVGGSATAAHAAPVHGTTGNVSAVSSVSPPVAAGPSVPQAPAGWAGYQDGDGMFSLSYPKSWTNQSSPDRFALHSPDGLVTVSAFTTKRHPAPQGWFQRDVVPVNSWVAEGFADRLEQPGGELSAVHAGTGYIRNETTPSYDTAVWTLSQVNSGGTVGVSNGSESSELVVVIYVHQVNPTNERATDEQIAQRVTALENSPTGKELTTLVNSVREVK